MWAEDDRPREKMLLKGRGALSDSELIAILIGSGTRSKTAVELGQELLLTANNSLSDFAKKTIEELQVVKGIGEAKAITIAAALELGRRRKDVEIDKRTKITSARMAYQLLSSHFEDLKIEKFYILLLDRSSRLIAIKCVSEGGMTSTIADFKVIFKLAIDAQAHAMILAHNHPSGRLYPSEEDIRLTKKIVEFGRMIDLPIVDHLIYTETGYYSFADEGAI